MQAHQTYPKLSIGVQQSLYVYVTCMRLSFVPFLRRYALVIDGQPVKNEKSTRFVCIVFRIEVVKDDRQTLN